MKHLRYLLTFPVVLACLPVSAAPNTTSSTGTDRGASVTLTTWERVIIDDERSRCEVQIECTDAELAFTQGDTAIISIYEDDNFGDDLVWQESFEVSRAEVDAGFVSRSFDCSSNFGRDGFGQVEIYASAIFLKEECGTFCSNESPQTNTIQLDEIEDDEDEDDDSAAAAVSASMEETDRVCRDEDWLEVEISEGATDLRLLVAHLPEFGRVEAALFDAFDNRIADGEDVDGGTILSRDSLPVGTYRIRLSPRVADDFNFYDTRLILDPSSNACAPGAREDRACGNCGTQVRTCDNNGSWSPFDNCSGEGECTVGDTRGTVCGNCGSIPEVCDGACTWRQDGVCGGEGECARGDTDRRECDGGFEFRTCDESCLWGPFENCAGAECEDAAVRNCYSGPEGTQDVGACQGGRQVCEGGRFGACIGEILPLEERCGDTRDNDCDGQTDADDADCSEQGSTLGSACRLSSECAGAMTCLINQFTNGYCSTEDCTSDADCGPLGICGDAFGQQVCLLSCVTDVTCRQSYLCANVGGAIQGCIPRCDEDADCTDPTSPFCEIQSGLCAADPGENNSPQPEPSPQPDSSPSAQPGDQPLPATTNEGGCVLAAAPLHEQPWHAPLLGLGLLIVAGLRRRG